jgi:hypothetical protein
VTQVQEQDEAQDEPTPAASLETVIDEEAEEEAAHERETAGDEPTEARGPQMGSEKDLRALERKLTGERDRHAKRLGDLLGDAATDALPCPLCFEGLMGFVLPGDAASLPDAQRDAALAFLGQEIGSGMPQTPDTETCSRCGGYGETANPTKAAHYLTSQCAPCGGQGYIKHQAQPSSVASLPGVVQAADAITNGVVPPCPLCGAVNSAGRPHFCNPVAQAVT